MFYSLGHGVLVPLSRLLYRPTIEGKENVPLDGGVILASNHLSFIDSIAIPLVSPRKVRFLAKEEYWTGDGVKGLLQKGFFTAVGMVPVNRQSPTAAQESLDKGLEVLKAGDAFGIYPEGTRSRDGSLYRGRTGVAWLALNAQVPVVPVGLIGTQDIQPVGARFPRLAKVTVRFGTPIGVEAYQGLPAGRARRQLTDDVMDAIAALTGQQRVNAYNDVPGEVSED
ncbi:MAG TPA: lysophospholipid acyltransferase family protein [Intrasporangium sp.]|uniref:lysophospholipid acyltransferase family protein n=1 Tax=Intrasporangium sp. TaxID=1925024 RepID=UPI002B4A4487|nr:lysophospholipid acyltransferase family protein [Intrasporangium sp.]HKX66581.1 lysophospholipid acyltransferase family protein [Intrasporangium sp.]